MFSSDGLLFARTLDRLDDALGLWDGAMGLVVWAAASCSTCADVFEDLLGSSQRSCKRLTSSTV
jgi:hypothetical protein